MDKTVWQTDSGLTIARTIEVYLKFKTLQGPH